MKSLVLIGGGGHCRSCIDVIEATGEFSIHGILDSIKNPGDTVLGYPVLGSDALLEELAAQGHSFLITIGQIRNVEPRVKLFERLRAAAADMPVIVSPLAHVSKHATLGSGTIVMHFALVNAAAEIGENCIINTRALVEHDVKIGSHCHLSTGAILNGGAQLGSYSFVGSAAVSREAVVIDEGSFIKANSLVK
jgi:sugar O-acyltransferase (sialic acid O-acetyltransferase NeuD family)